MALTPVDLRKRRRIAVGALELADAYPCPQRACRRVSGGARGLKWPIPLAPTGGRVGGQTGV